MRSTSKDSQPPSLPDVTGPRSAEHDKAPFAVHPDCRRFPEITHQLVPPGRMVAARRSSTASAATSRGDPDAAPIRKVVTKRGQEFAEVPAGEFSCGDAGRMVRDTCSCMSVTDLPIANWLPRYSLGTLRSDLIAGLSVGVLLIPQSMAYSLLAGLPPIHGLYSSTIPLFVYALLASSTKVSLGPVAPTAILINGIIISAAANKNDPAELATLASAVAFCCGLLQIVLGLLRFGFVAQLLSWPVMSGYLAGAAITIVVSQLHDFFGLSYPDDVNDRLFYERIANFFTYIGTASLPTTLISLGCLFVLVGFKYLPACGLWRPVCRRTCGPKPPAWIPLQLLVVVATIGIAVGLGVTLQDNKGVAVVGTIPPGFPTPAFPIKDGETFLRLLPQSFVLAVIAYVGTISLGVSFARKDNEEVSPNMELLASGSACLVGSFFQGFAIAGSFTRTAVNASIGAKTPMSVAFTGTLIIITLLFISPLFELLPKAALASMVIASTQSLIKPVEFLNFWRRKRLDAFQTALTFILTLWLGVDWGIIAAVGVALAILVLKSFKPRITELGNLTGTDVFVDRARYPEARMVPGTIVYRVDGDLHFGNIKTVATLLQRTLASAIAAGALPEPFAPLEGGSADGSASEGADGSTDGLGGKAKPSAVELTGVVVDGAAGADVGSGSATAKSTSGPSVVAGQHDATAVSRGVERRVSGGSSGATGSGQRPSPRGGGAATSRALGIHADCADGADRACGDDDSVAHIRAGSGASPRQLAPVTAGAADCCDDAGACVAGGSCDCGDGCADAGAPAPGDGPAHARRASALERLDAERAAMLASSVLRAVVVDCVRVSAVDLTACRELQDIVGSYADKGICLLFAALPGPSRDVMERFGVMKPLDDALGTRSRFITVAAAVESVVPRAAWEVDLPLTKTGH
ncbi:hypothetical protein FNF31_06039 [Cafeteria roenbergensis]|uniref:STAS domain-containing protein n=1 Tax=Cafeteria roenbergensis TaxID=33653 RepID=A0A5A8CTJ3_CAFRO|nr:hypothetical protein FNF31_06039 [Cafeteria roenbergensis]